MSPHSFGCQTKFSMFVQLQTTKLTESEESEVSLSHCHCTKLLNQCKYSTVKLQYSFPLDLDIYTTNLFNHRLLK